jgi:hypothetical protein
MRSEDGYGAPEERYSPECVEKENSAKFASRILHITSPESREEGFWGTSRHARGDYM